MAHFVCKRTRSLNQIPRRWRQFRQADFLSAEWLARVGQYAGMTPDRARHTPKMPSPGKDEFLAVYDYGMGGIWLKITASSREEIIERYPQLTVFAEDERPGWMTDAQEDEYTSEMRFDLDAHEGTWLAGLA